MGPDRYVASLSDDRGRLAALDEADLDRSVPSCPDWDLRQLLVHVGRVNRWARLAMDLAPDAEYPRFGPRPDEGESVLTWVQDGLADLIAYLGSTDLDEPCWTFVGPGTRRFWSRRQAMEVAVHRWDAEHAVGIAAAVDADVAADGVEEWLDVQSARWFQGGDPIHGSVHLHATDGEGEWFAEVDGDRLEWRPGHHKGDVAVRGSRSDLLLLAWRRRDPSELEVLGDAAFLDAFLERVPVF
jgi:uncharacterized protein (TIGR03083 family)